MSALKEACTAAVTLASGDKAKARVNILLINGTLITGQPEVWGDETAKLMKCQFGGSTGSVNGAVTGPTFISSIHVAAAWPSI